MTRLALVAAATPARGLTIGVFIAVLAVTLGITFWAARGIHSASDFWSAGRGISGAQNGMAIAGEFLSAAAFLGVSGLMFLSGFDGYLTGVLVSPRLIAPSRWIAGFWSEDDPVFDDIRLAP